MAVDSFDPMSKRPFSYIPGLPGLMQVQDVAEAMGLTLAGFNSLRATTFIDPDVVLASRPLWDEQSLMQYCAGRPTRFSSLFFARMNLFGFEARYKEPAKKRSI